MDDQQTTSPAEDNNSTQQNSDDALRSLALRLLAPHYPGAPAPEQTQLLVGKLPDALQLDVPLPDGSSILGSMVHDQQHISIVVDATLPPQGVLDFYRERMTAAGWNEPAAQPYGGGGFTFVGRHMPTVFCRGARGPALAVKADTGQNGLTDVRLDLNFDARHSPCAQHGRHGSMLDIIPPLTPPPGARQNSGGGGGGSDQWYTSASLETELELAAVAAHYAQQLEGAGWTRREGGQSGPAAWSTWALRDADGQDCRGMFFVLQEPDIQGQYYLYIRVTLAAEEGAGAGPSASWTPMYLS